MAYKELTLDLINEVANEGDVFVSKTELMSQTGVGKSVMWDHINKD